MSGENGKEDETSADEYRQMGNHAFSQGDYDRALPLYSMAIDAAQRSVDEDLRVVSLCNRSACLFKMERYEEARNDAQEAVQLSHGKNTKAHFRLARTQMMLHEHVNAVKTIEAALGEIETQTAETLKGDDRAVTDQQQQLGQQRVEFDKLLQAARKQMARLGETKEVVIQSIKKEARQPSIREFELGQQLGMGNFSAVYVATHKVTGETFAIKAIEKKEAANLAKRQHPNVYNEIQMERRLLTERLREYPHPNIIHMYHAFQDYNTIFYLMDLHLEGGDLWSTIKLKPKMVGCHPSLVRIYVYELVAALEHIHSHGIIHRDLKPENVLLSASGHIILHDFGTAKDLIETDLNGPEFVGTPDFMAPEAVKGSSGDDEVRREKGLSTGSDHAVDLWALGAVAFQLYAGATPFATPSQYLTFLKIQRGNLYRHLGIVDDDAWDLIQHLMRVKPHERLGYGGFHLEETAGNKRMVKETGGYDVIRNHPYFSPLYTSTEGDDGRKGARHVIEQTPIPSLRDLCIRSCAKLVEQDSFNLEIDSEHPPGDGSSHDMLRLNPTDRKSILHVLNRMQQLANPRVYRRFFLKKAEARLNKIREETRDFVGLTQLVDKQGTFPSTSTEDGQNPTQTVPLEPIRVVFLTSPLLDRETNISCTDESQRSEWMQELKECIRTINRTRPKAVIASGYIDDACRKLLSKVNETIPLVVHDGSTFFSAWVCGAQMLMLRASDWTGKGTKEEAREQMKWLREQMEQSRMARYHAFAFVESDPQTALPNWLVRTLAQSRTLCLFGPSTKGTIETKHKYDYNKKSEIRRPTTADEDDEMSSESEPEESDIRCMSILGNSNSGLCSATLEEYGEWKSEFINLSANK
uniref:non-specific serine/threonine protein kinase n=1 Tax=Attheya septentrionalis TaxID=420275 RepID=A0A7S2UM73_9STRA|mmetsp:Transcript_4186/g.7506  ORF Transcript_4186/g.7506 Transcript_4186/m.7506 type:complete len:866 (+) Transcript_4186:92-2689(+)